MTARRIAVAVAVVVLGLALGFVVRPGGVSVIEYVARGVAGGGAAPSQAVPASLAEPARRLRDSHPAFATDLPEGALVVNVDVAGAYLDAKNVAAEVDAGGTGKQALLERWSAARKRQPGRPALEPGQDAAWYYRNRLTSLLAARSRIVGAPELHQRVRLVRPGDTGAVPILADRVAVAEAVTVRSPVGTVLAATAAVAAEVAGSPIPQRGEPAGAILAAADSPSAPPSARRVATFEPAERESGPDGVPDEVRLLDAASAPAPDGSRTLAWESPQGRRTVTVRDLEGYRHAVLGTYYLVLPSRDVALTDGSLLGWAFTTVRANLVDASRIGRVLAVYPAP